jgi:transposase
MVRNRNAKRHLSTEQKAKIVGMSDAGMTPTAIGSQLGIGRTTISAIITRSAERGTVVTAPRSGRPRMTNDRDLRELEKVLNDNPRMKMAEVKDILTTPISTKTARRRAHEMGFNNRVAVRKPFLNETHRRCRLQFAKRHKDWTPDDWRMVLWTDESSFEIGKSSKQVVVWRKRGDKHDPKNLVPTFKSGRKSTMVWGAFFSKIKAPPGERKAESFVKNIYEKHLIPFLKDADPDQRISLMEDNAPVHTARVSREFLDSYNINKIDWPAQSPDLNPIENVWLVLKRNVQDLYHPRLVPEMHEALTQAWADFPSHILENLINSMPERMADVIKAEGGSVRW